MKSKSINCNDITFSNEEKEDIHSERFSYGSISPYNPNTPWEVSHERYGKMIKFLSDKNLLNTYDLIVIEIRKLYSSEVNRLNIQFSKVGESNSWIEWDVLKQLYFFLCSESPDYNDKYRIANPLEDKLIRQEIVNRHIGWEYWHKKNNGIETRWDKDGKVNEVLNNSKYRSSFPFPEEMKRGTEVSSWGLELLGRRIRELG